MIKVAYVKKVTQNSSPTENSLFQNVEPTMCKGKKVICLDISINHLSSTS